MAKKKQLISINLEIDFILFGIVSQLKDYRLCHELNHKLQIDLKKIESLDFYLTKEDKAEFSLFCHHVNEEKAIYVISNRSGKDFLIPEQRQINYFIMFKGQFRTDEVIEARTKS